MSQTPLTSEQKFARGADWTVTIILICAQAFGSFLVGSLSMFFAMISDGCHDEPDDPFICSDSGGAVFFGGLLLEWLLLFCGVILSIVLALRASAAGRRTWTKPFIGTAVGLLGVLIMVVTITVSAS